MDAPRQGHRKGVALNLDESGEHIEERLLTQDEITVTEVALIGWTV
jgi:hypothetical protein